jgi:cytochrome c2
MSGDDRRMIPPSLPGAGKRISVLAAAAAAVGLLAGTACRDAPPGSPSYVPGGDPARGRLVVATYGCGSCHAIPGVPGAVGRVGPSLGGVGERAYLVGGLRNEPSALVRWIRFPQDIEPGTVMPALGVSEGDARDIAAYLYSLAAGGLGPPHLLSPQAIPGH